MSGDDVVMIPKSVADDTGWYIHIVEELRRLDGEQWDRKKKDTIIALIDARLSGAPEESVWSRPQTCARSTWHDKWKSDSLISSVLDSCRRLVDEWRDDRGSLAIAETAQRMKLESPASLDEVIRVRDLGGDDADRLRAALAILDRIEGLGSKTEQKITHAVSADEFARIQREAEVEVRRLEKLAEDGWDSDAGAPGD
jgi:hypothetical protein